jgi:hypothetical protein
LLATPATPALAAKITEASKDSVSIDAGGSESVSVTVTTDLGEDSATITVTGLPDGVSCGGCGDIEFQGPPGMPKTKQVTLTLSAAQSAKAANGVRATIRVEGSGGSDARALSVSVKAAQPQTVKSVSGKVVAAANGQAVPNVIVMLQDGTGRRFDTTSDSSGNFRFTGSSSNPIAPGRLTLGAIQGEVRATKSFNAGPGDTITGQRISLAIPVEVTPSPTPSPTEEVLPTEEPTEEAVEAVEEATAAAPQTAAAQEEGSGFGSWLLILLGGLFVAVGVGTMVLLWMKRRENADDVDDTDSTGPGGAGAVPAARGAFRGTDDQTRVVNPVGAAGADRTMVAGTSLSDAPTMMHQPVVDDVPPDPYGAPPPSFGGSGGQQGWAGSGYGDEPQGSGGYGTGGGYGSASGGGAYGSASSSGGGYGSRDYGAPAGASAGGYGGQGGGYGERYDEPTGRYTGEPAGSYPPPADPYPTTTYQPEQELGYGATQQYGRGGDSGRDYGGGYGQPGGYDSAPTGGGYDSGRQGYDGGYDRAGGGYGNDSYGQPGGYGQEPPRQRGGYEGHGYDRQGGYDRAGGGYESHGYDRQSAYDQQGGGYYGDPAQGARGRSDGPPPQDRGGRRLDWLDD